MRPSCNALHERLAGALPGAIIAVHDDSAAHAGHAGAQGGAGHYSVSICSEYFIGKTTVARHRLVYDALRDWIPTRIHALSIVARTPDETTSL